MRAFWDLASTLGSSKLLIPAAIVTVVAGRMRGAVVTLAFALSWALDTIWLSDVRTESLIIHTALSLSHRDVPYHWHHLPRSKGAEKVHDS
jgi:hypothetical protein